MPVKKKINVNLKDICSKPKGGAGLMVSQTSQGEKIRKSRELINRWMALIASIVFINIIVGLFRPEMMSAITGMLGLVIVGFCGSLYINTSYASKVYSLEKD